MQFGAYSVGLSVLAVQALVLGALMLGAGGNLLANRLLAALMLVFAGLATPFIIGYAGAYDTWPWLSFAPFALPFAVGPLLYAYVVALASGALIGRWHFALPGVHFLYQALIFIQPLETKDWVDANIQSAWLSPLIDVAAPLSLAVYAWLAWITTRDYADWLMSRRRRLVPAERLKAAVIVLLVLAALRTGFELADQFWRPLNYFDLYGYYLALGIMALVLGVEGWRNADAPPPLQTPVPADTAEAAQGARWLGAIAAEELWRDPEASLDTLARRFATNRTTLSRALNATGETLSEALIRMRVDAAARALEETGSRDVTVIAYDAGFGSKAAFNRAFKQRTGMTPTQYRQSRRKG